MTDISKNKNLLPQFRYSLGRSSFLRPQESKERFGYFTHTLQLAWVYPHGEAFCGFLGVGGSFAHADESALGSRRFLMNLEGGVRAFIPWRPLRLFALEAGATAGIGFSHLNFGGGNNPTSRQDSQIGLTARGLIHYKGFDFGAGVLYSSSPARDYGELGFLAFLAIPLKAGPSIEITETRQKEEGHECETLAKLENEVVSKLEAASTNLAKARSLFEQIEEEQRRNQKLHALQLQRQKYLEANSFQCSPLPLLEKVEVDYPLSLPKRLLENTCARQLPPTRQYLKDLEKTHQDLMGPKGLYKKMEIALGKINGTGRLLENWDVDCVRSNFKGLSSVTLITTEKGTYRLLSEILFSNDNPDLALVPQKDSGQSAGFTEPYLDEWIRFLRQGNVVETSYKIRIDGYASDQYRSDTTWDEEDMLKLASRRAQNVFLYLTERGRENAFYLHENKMKDPIHGPFIAMEVSGAVRPEWVQETRGHGKEGLLQLLRERFGRQSERTLLFKTQSDPTFRMVKITLLQKNSSGEWVPIRLVEEGRKHGS